MCRTPCWPISVGQNVGTACPIIDEDASVFQFLVKNHIDMTHYFSTWHTLIHTYSCVYFVVLGIDPRILPRPGYYEYLLMTVWETWRGRLLCAFILWMSMFVSLCAEKNQKTLSFGPSSFDLLLLPFLFFTSSAIYEHIFFARSWEYRSKWDCPFVQDHFHTGLLTFGQLWHKCLTSNSSMTETVCIEKMHSFVECELNFQKDFFV